VHKGQSFAAIAAVSLLGCGAMDREETKPDDGSAVISLNSVTIQPGDALTSIPEHLRAAPGDAVAQAVVLVKFPGPITAEQERALRSAAARVYTYLPYYSYLVRMPPGVQGSAVLASAGAVWSGPYHPFYKISRSVAAIRADDALLPPPHGPRKSVMIQVYPDADLEGVVQAIRALGAGEIAGQGRNALFSRIRVMLSPAEIAEVRDRLAQIPDVFWIDTEPRKALLNDTTIWVGQSGLNGGMATPVFDRGIYGEGQVVAVLDTGIDPDMCYFRDLAAGPPPRNECDGGTTVDLAQRKVIAVNFLWSNECAGGIDSGEWDNHDHGSHVAGTVAGDNFVQPLSHDAGDGMAPGARLVIQDGGIEINDCADLPGIGCPVVDLNPIFQQTYDQGARIHTNSWGDQENNPIQNDYTAACQDVDEFMWAHKDFLVVFAAGNSGPGAESVGSPSTAKSAVSVGATQRGLSAGSMAGFSSCGPTDDGRIKPEVTIPGSSIVSANSDNNASSQNCNTRTMSGTSMAAPGAAGLLALIRQYYADGWYPSGGKAPADGFTPSAALLRATLVNAGEPMNSGIIPANCEAWGRVLLDNALHFFPEERRLFVEDDAAGFPTGSVNEAKSFTLTVPQSVESLKATLAWTDYPSTPAALPHINNDLDLEVTGPSGAFLGNVFANGASTQGGSPDRINTLEQVLLSNPMPGEYTVTVRSFNVPNGPQPYALVVSSAAVLPGTPGTGCAMASDCLSGYCVDGFCCDTACDAGPCDACSTQAGAQVDGACELFTGNPCDDADACTQTDTCETGVCVGASPVVCAAMDACHDVGTCDPATGACNNPALPDGTACDDGDACTETDTCQAGACAGADPVACSASDECHEAGACDPATGACSNPAKPDGAPCAGGQCLGGVCEPDANTSSGSGSGPIDGPDPGEPAGCGCGVASSPKGGIAGLGLGLLFLLRRRRRMA
jgi:MYXO-CTERM domain-containing protein